MSGDLPSLDDALAKGFAELKIGEENIQVEQETSTPTPVTGGQDTGAPIKYNHRIHAEISQPIVVKADDSTTAVRSGAMREQQVQDELGNDELAADGTTAGRAAADDGTQVDASEPEQIPVQVEILDKPSTTLGDDFDVEW